MKFLLYFTISTVWSLAAYGQPEQAPYLSPAQIHSALKVSVCQRTSQVRNAIINKLHDFLSISKADLTAEGCYLANELVGNIETLNLSGQRITSLKPGDFSNMATLHFISLTGNKLKTLPTGVFGGALNLRTIHMDDNQIEVLERGTFSGIDSDSLFIKLNDNRLTTLPPGIFNNINYLKINLSDNQITHLPPKIFSNLHPAGIFCPVIALKGNNFSGSEKARLLIELSASHPGCFSM